MSLFPIFITLRQEIFPFIIPLHTVSTVSSDLYDESSCSFVNQPKQIHKPIAQSSVLVFSPPGPYFTKLLWWVIFYYITEYYIDKKYKILID